MQACMMLLEEKAKLCKKRLTEVEETEREE